MTDNYPKRGPVESIASMLIWGLIFSTIWDYLFAPLRWIFGLRYLGTSIRTCFLGYFILVFFYLPIMMILVEIWYLKDPGQFYMCMGGKVAQVMTNPAVAFTLWPVVLVIFFIIMKLETLATRQYGE